MILEQENFGYERAHIILIILREAQQQTEEDFNPT
jgi:hypothetical protein